MPGITLDSVNEERTVYLIHEDDVDPPAVLLSWIEQNFLTLFENELEGWYVDESLWPKQRDFSTFNAWFSVECHTIIIDTVGGDIFDDEV